MFHYAKHIALKYIALLLKKKTVEVSTRKGSGEHRSCSNNDNVKLKTVLEI